MAMAQVQVRCRMCKGKKTMPAPGRKWWQFWRNSECWPCNGTGSVTIEIERPEPPRRIAHLPSILAEVDQLNNEDLNWLQKYVVNLTLLRAIEDDESEE